MSPPSRQRPPSPRSRLAERNRKGRERSLRTRQRNAYRLQLLQANCGYLTQENALLHSLITHTRSLPCPRDFDVLSPLLSQLRALRVQRPDPYNRDDDTPAC